MQGFRVDGRPRQAPLIATEPPADGILECSVAAAGPGLLADVRAWLFQPFVTTQRSGRGVGLPICRSIIEAHGGRVCDDASAATPGAPFDFTMSGPRAAE